MPDGDASGLHLPLMQDFLQTVTPLRDLLERSGISFEKRNFEEIYSDLAETDAWQILEAAETIIYDYFASLVLMRISNNRGLPDIQEELGRPISGSISMESGSQTRESLLAQGLVTCRGGHQDLLKVNDWHLSLPRHPDPRIHDAAALAWRHGEDRVQIQFHDLRHLFHQP